MATATAPNTKPTLAGSIVVAALVLVLAWQLAYWTWELLAPAARMAPAEARSDVDMAAVARLFGAAAPGDGAAPASGALRLKGVIAPTPGVEASAIFSLGAGKDFGVYIGREVQQGMKLVEVDPDHVMVEQAGVRSRIDLETRRTNVAAATAPGARTQGFKLNVSRASANNFTLSRKELDLALRDPNQLNYLGTIGGTPPTGGVRMETAPPNSLAQKLGLMPGDVIKKLNGQAVASTGDLARIYTQFGTLSMIQAEVQRGGATVQLSYSIQP